MKFDKTTSEKIKEAVKTRYAQAISKPVASCCGQKQEKDLSPDKLLCMAGYREQELGSVSAEVAQSSLGCGNPLAMAEVLPGQKVLDLGSGAGLDCFIAAEKVGPQGKVYGLDMTPEMIAQARKNATAGGFTNVEFLLGEIENIPLPDNSVDWVISNCVLNLSPEKAKVFKEIARVLRPGGRISISDMVAQDLPPELQQSLAVWAACLGGAFSEEEYLAGLQQAGLKEVKVTSRYVYSLEEMEAFVNAGPCSEGIPPELIAAAARYKSQLNGKIWSAQFEGLKK